MSHISGLIVFLPKTCIKDKHSFLNFKLTTVCNVGQLLVSFSLCALFFLPQACKLWCDLLQMSLSYLLLSWNSFFPPWTSHMMTSFLNHPVSVSCHRFSSSHPSLRHYRPQSTHLGLSLVTLSILVAYTYLDVTKSSETKPSPEVHIHIFNHLLVISIRTRGYPIRQQYKILSTSFSIWSQEWQTRD